MRLRDSAKNALWFCLGVVFLLTLIPPILIVAAVAIAGGQLERE